MTTSVMISRYQLIGNLICETVLSGLSTSYILSNLQCGSSEKNAAQSRAVIISHTTLCQATILHLSYSILRNPCNIFSNLSNLIPTLHSNQRINSFWCNRKTTTLTELLPPPSSMHIVLHHFCWFINLLIVEKFFKHHI
jgi:hypothetical protein